MSWSVAVEGTAGEQLRILTFTTLYPNSRQPMHGVFVEQRVRQLVATGKLEARVVAPVPWFPWRASLFGRYATYAGVPRSEIRHGIQVSHPRFAALPKVGMNVAPRLLAQGSWSALRALKESYRFAVLDAHYFYPDGVAAVEIGRELGVPVVVTARGSDVNLLSHFDVPRRRIVQAAQDAAAVISVSCALRDALAELGVPRSRIHVLRNGVDLKLFAPRDARSTRERLRVHGFLLLSVGSLFEFKGLDLVVSALAQLPDVSLVVVGEGPERGRLEHLARTLGVIDRVHFVGACPHEDTHRYYNAADALVLASSREGLPNVVLEALACGTPVIATSVGGIPEVVKGGQAGLLMSERSIPAIVDAVNRLRENFPVRQIVRKYAEGFDWKSVIDNQISLYQEIA